MTQLSELSGDRIALNPDVPFPPFPVWMQLPSTWSRLDSHPGTWRRSADDLIDTSWRGSRLPASARRDVLALLEGLVADCQRAGAALSLIKVGRLAEGGAASFGIHLAFADGGRPASLGQVHDMLPRTGLTSEIPTSSGPALLHRDRTTMVVPGTGSIAALTSLQIFLPFPDTTWTLVLSTASAYPKLTEALESLLTTAAASVTAGHAGSADGRPAESQPVHGSTEDSPAAEPAVSESPAVPGFGDSPAAKPSVPESPAVPRFGDSPAAEPAVPESPAVPGFGDSPAAEPAVPESPAVPGFGDSPAAEPSVPESPAVPGFGAGLGPTMMCRMDPPAQPLQDGGR